MPVETATTINQLDATRPGANDLKSEGDDHLRLLKSTIKTTFPNITGVVTATQAELNGIAAKANIASPTFSGTPLAPTAAPGTNTPQISTTAFVQAGLTLKANVASPAFTGTPTAPTPATADNSTQLATTAHVQAVFGTAPVGTLPTVIGNALKSLRVNAGETGVEWASPPALELNGAVGAYALAYNFTGSNIDYGGTIAGSDLRSAGGGSSDWSKSLISFAGTWRNMSGGQTDAKVNASNHGLFLRIS